MLHLSPPPHLSRGPFSCRAPTGRGCAATQFSARILTAHRFNELGFWPDVYFPRAWHPIAVPHMLSTRTSCFLKSRPQLLGFVGLKYGMPSKELQNKCLHFSICARHPCAGAMLIFSVSFQF